tara:strand:- start:58 stop:615 length:558 start_codon:yes stop_codon:yes gene_type:complete
MSNLLVQNIKHTNGTTAQTIDSSGNTTVSQNLTVSGSQILTPARPFFHVYIDNSGSNPNSGGTSHLVPFDGVVSNVGSHFNATSSGNGYSFTAPVAGVYQFNWNLSIYGISSGQYFRQQVRKNGSAYQYLEYKDSQTTDDQNINSGFAILLSASDYIQFYAQTQSGTFNYSAGSNWNTCTGYLVG